MAATWARAIAAGAMLVAVGTASVAGTGPRRASASQAATASAASPAYVAIVGHGYGGGEGMGQWGAFGYALDGLGYRAILAHYYGGTTVAQVPNRPIRVVLTAENAMDTMVTSASAFTVAGHVFAAGRAARMHLLASGDFSLSAANTCTAATWTPVATLSPAQAVAIPANGGPGASASQVLRVCGVGTPAAYRGDIEAASYDGVARTLNVVTLESYLRGVVGSESPAFWGTLGGPGPQGQRRGFQELEAQAVAARSYAVSALGQYGYADICDTTSCQVYRGLAGESPLSDLAVADTAGQVLDLASGRVATTFYSASTGGYTSGGAFPAVPDLGDSVCVPFACNPAHNWSAKVSVASVDATWPQIGTLRVIDVTSRNGLGALGGRVESMTLTGSAGQVDISGAEFAGALGLDSNWFAVASLGSPRLGGYRVIDSAGDVLDAGAAAYHGSLSGSVLGAPVVAAASTSGGAGYLMLASDGQVFGFGGAHAYRSAQTLHLGNSFVGIAPTPDGGGYWLATRGGGVYTYGDAGFHGSEGGRRLPSPVVAMAPTPDGGGYWLVSAAGAVYGFGDAQDLGSAPPNLAVPFVGIAPTLDGGGYWLLQANGGVFSFGDATYSGSLPGRKLAARTAAMVPSPDGGGYLIGSAKGVVYSFGDAPSLAQVSPAAVHGHAVALLGVVAPSG